MIPTPTRLLVALLALAVSAPFAAAQGNLVGNGGFEHPAVNPGERRATRHIDDWSFTAVGGLRDEGVFCPNSSNGAFLTPVPQGYQVLWLQEATLVQKIGRVKAGSCILRGCAYVESQSASTNALRLYAGHTLLLELVPTAEGEWECLQGTINIARGSHLIGLDLTVEIDQWANPNTFSYWDDISVVCGTNPCVPSFVHTVVRSHQGANAAAGNNAHNAVGNHPNTFFQAGSNGSITVSFGGELSTSGDSGADLCLEEPGDQDCYFLIFEPANATTGSILDNAGWTRESNGDYRFPGGVLCGNEDIDIDAAIPGYLAGDLLFASVTVLDDNSNQPSGNNNGFEISTLEAKFVCPPSGNNPLGNCGPSFITEVRNAIVGNNQLAQTDPLAVLGDDTSIRWSAGEGGEITVAFGGNVSNDGTSAPDICIDEYNVPDGYFVAFRAGNLATAAALGAAGLTFNGDDFLLAGSAFVSDADLDLDALFPGLPAESLAIDAIRLIDDGTQNPGDDNGFELVRVEAKVVCPCRTPSPTFRSIECGFSAQFDPVLTLSPLLADSALSFRIETEFPGQPVWLYAQIGPIAPYQINGCNFVVRLGEFITLYQSVTDAMGDVNETLPLNLHPAFIGLELGFQARVCAPAFGIPGPFAPLPDFFSNNLITSIGCP